MLLRSKKVKDKFKSGDLMKRLSDVIEEFIKEMLSESDGIIELQRNEVANRFNCVPSQINYVIDTRFSPEHGYYVESRRGGGGCITIKKVMISSGDYLMHIINNIGDSISQQDCYYFINNFVDYGIINNRESKIMKAATNDKTLNLHQSVRDNFRANILKNMLIILVNCE
jgi:transcriptional regulator CtsR